MTNDKGLIVALDVDTPLQARTLVERLGPAVDFYKVAPSLVFQDPAFIAWLTQAGKRVFLDCKWYDIPSQVKRSVEMAGRLGVTSCTVHVSGGTAMMKAALAADPRPHVWGVTVLTSMGAADLAELGTLVSPAEQVLRLAKLAQAAGLNGLVCSPQEAAFLRKSGITVTLITPGIQHGEVLGKDQKRAASPHDAWKAGADYIVVGRSILAAKDPARAAADILKIRESL